MCVSTRTNNGNGMHAAALLDPYTRESVRFESPTHHVNMYIPINTYTKYLVYTYVHHARETPGRHKQYSLLCARARIVSIVKITCTNHPINSKLYDNFFMETETVAKNHNYISMNL